MPTLNKIPKFIAVCLLSACSIASIFEKTPPSIQATESIFLETNPNSQITFVMTDSLIPNLKESVTKELALTNMQVTQNYSEANIILKVKTRFSGKVLKKDMAKLLEDEVSFAAISNFEIKEKPQIQAEKITMIDRMIEDPSGMIAGFAIGAAMANPVVFAPIGMIAGSGINFAIGSIFGNTQQITILDIEIHEKTAKPIWYTEKRIQKKDEYSIRKYDYSQETNWKIYKTRIIAHNTTENLHKQVVALVL
jgi:hypothetical protein